MTANLLGADRILTPTSTIRSVSLPCEMGLITAGAHCQVMRVVSVKAPKEGQGPVRGPEAAVTRVCEAAPLAATECVLFSRHRMNTGDLAVKPTPILTLSSQARGKGRGEVTE